MRVCYQRYSKDMNKIGTKALIVLVSIVLWIFLVPFILALIVGIFIGGLIALVLLLLGLPVVKILDLRDKQKYRLK